MHYLIIGKQNTGIETISEELELHGHAVPQKFEDGMSSDVPIILFAEPDELIAYANNNPDEVFHLIYIQSPTKIRQMRMLSLAKDQDEADALAQTINTILTDEDNKFEELEKAISNAEQGNTENQNLPQNITAVFSYTNDFTPHTTSNIAADIVSIDITYRNAYTLVNKAIENDLIDTVDDMVLAPTASDPNHCISKDFATDLILSSEASLGHLTRLLLADEQLFRQDMRPLSSESTTGDTPVEGSSE